MYQDAVEWVVEMSKQGVSGSISVWLSQFANTYIDDNSSILQTGVRKFLNFYCTGSNATEITDADAKTCFVDGDQGRRAIKFAIETRQNGSSYSGATGWRDAFLETESGNTTTPESSTTTSGTESSTTTSESQSWSYTDFSSNALMFIDYAYRSNSDGSTEISEENLNNYYNTTTGKELIDWVLSENGTSMASTTVNGYLEAWGDQKGALPSPEAFTNYEGFSSNNYYDKVVSGELTMLPFRARQWSINDGVHTIYSGYTSQDLISNTYNAAISSSQYTNNSTTIDNNVTTTINNILNSTTQSANVQSNTTTQGANVQSNTTTQGANVQSNTTTRVESFIGNNDITTSTINQILNGNIPKY